MRRLIRVRSRCTDRGRKSRDGSGRFLFSEASDFGLVLGSIVEMNNPGLTKDEIACGWYQHDTGFDPIRVRVVGLRWVTGPPISWSAGQ